MKTLFIVNPAAGHGRGLRRWQAVEAQARRACPDLQVRLTEKLGDGAAQARQALADGFEALIAVGGDGTLGEVVDGWLSAPSRPLAGAVGTWPVGSGCDLARHIGMKQSAASLLRILSGPVRRNLDAGLVTYRDPQGKAARRYFLNVAAFGLAGDVALRVAARGKRWGGTLTYLVESLAALTQAEAKPMDLIIDGVAQPRTRYHMVVLANTSTFGGGMRVAPKADAEDGRLDLLTVGDLSRGRLFQRFPSIYTGGHLGKPGIGWQLARKVEADSPVTVTLNIDGEAIGTLPAVFETLAGAVPFLCPT